MHEACRPDHQASGDASDGKADEHNGSHAVVHHQPFLALISTGITPAGHTKPQQGESIQLSDVITS